MKTKVVINPYSANRSTAKQWADKSGLLKEKIGRFDAELTSKPLEATEITQNALKDGYERIIAVGGDGTVNEVINGFFENDKPINPEAVLSFIMTGTGGDFRKTAGISKSITHAISQLAEGTVKKIDIGKLTYTTMDGNKKSTYFDNVASLGMSGAVNQIVNHSAISRMTKKISGTVAFFISTLCAVFSYKNKQVQIEIDGKVYDNLTVKLVAIANGKYFGGGMKIAPFAILDDGLFDIIFIENIGKLKMLLLSRDIYDGTQLGKEKVFSFRGKKIVATSDEEVLVEADGELLGKLPAVFEIMPHAINLKS